MKSPCCQADTARGVGFLQHRSFCMSCGQPVLDEPEPVYYQALSDSRKLAWRAVSAPFMPYKLKPGAVYIGALYDLDEKLWRMGRVVFCEECQHWEQAQDLGLHERSHEAAPITHFREDSIGTP